MTFGFFSYFIQHFSCALFSVVNINNQDHTFYCHIFFQYLHVSTSHNKRYSEKIDYGFEKEESKRKTKEGWFFISQCTQRSCFVFLFFQKNFFAHPQDRTDAEITEYACSLSKCAMGLMTVGTTQMKIPVVVNLFNVK